MKKNLFYTTVLLLIIIFFISFNQFLTWSNDYGFYFVGSNFLNNDYQLYEQHNESKGPAYLFFLKIIILIFGFGSFQAFLGLYFTLLLYIFSILFVSLKTFNEYYKIVTILIISVASLNFHDGNSSISFFQGAFLILTFFYIEKYYKLKRLSFLNFASFFFTITFLTRIEVLTFTPLLFLPIFILLKNKPLILCKHLLSAFSIILITFAIFSYVYSYDLYDFWYNNITINKSDVAYDWKNVKSKLFILKYRSEFILYLLSSGIIYFIIYFALNLTKTFKVLKKEIFPILFVIAGLATSVYIESPELKHSIIVVIPFIFFIIRFLLIDYWNLKIFSYLGVLFIIVMIYPELNKTIKNLNNIKCIKNMLCDSSRISLDVNFLEDVKNNKDSIILHANPWFYMLLNKYPKEGIITGRIYHDSNAYYMKSKYLIEMHHKYLKTQHLEFYMPNSTTENPNNYSKELIDSSILIKKYKNYSKFKKLIHQ